MKSKPNLDKMTYEEKEKRLEEILERLDRSETPMDELASDAREASQLIKSMKCTASVCVTPTSRRARLKPMNMPEK